LSFDDTTARLKLCRPSGSPTKLKKLTTALAASIRGTVDSMPGSTWSSSDTPTVGGTTDGPGASTWSTGPLPSGPFTRGIELTPGALVQGTYRIEHRIGAGAMGAVYSATHEKLGRRVALKLHLSPLPSARARTMREAQAMARLSHPNVVTVFDVGDTEGGIFIAMEFLAGGTARDWIRARRDWRAVADLFRRAGQGLAAAHAAGLVHRDFKPENVLIDAEGRPKVADFGIARAASDPEAVGPSRGGGPGGVCMPLDATVNAHVGAMDATLTQTGAFMGTPAYMAPEQFAGARVDARADQFAYCVAMWEALYGVRPFVGQTPAELYLAIRERRFAGTPSSARVPSGLRSELARGLSLDPATRHADMPALLSALDGAIRRRRILIVGSVVAGMLVLGAVGTAAAMSTRGRSSTDDTPPESALAVASSTGERSFAVPKSATDSASGSTTGAASGSTSADAGEAKTEPPETPPAPADPPVADGFKSPDYWDGTGQFKCHPAYPRVELRDRTIVIADESEALWIGGDCEVRVVNCDISGKTAVDIGGDAKVHIIDSTLRAKLHAVDIGGNAEVTVENTRVVGTTADSTYKAGGYAKMTLIDLDVRATLPLEIFGPATVRMDGGSLTGAAAAIQARSANSIKLRDVEVSGKIDQWNGAPVERLAANEPWGPEWTEP